jgi:hypothetical protein
MRDKNDMSFARTPPNSVSIRTETYIVLGFSLFESLRRYTPESRISTAISALATLGSIVSATVRLSLADEENAPATPSFFSSRSLRGPSDPVIEFVSAAAPAA